MKLHIRIKKIVDFFVVISKNDPSVTKIVELERKNTPSPLDEMQMERNLDRVNMWIGNCDQKASFLLAFLGVAATIFITSDVIGRIKELLVDPFVSYWKDGIGSFCLMRFLIAVFLIIGVICIFISLVFLLLCLNAKTDYSKFKQPGLEGKSLLFYQHIASFDYSEFSRAQNDRFNDIRSQTYVNSCICSDKFKFYKRGLVSSLVAIPSLALAFLFFLFI